MNREDIAKELRAVADAMHEVGVKMDYYGGLDTEMTAKASEIIVASEIVRSWAEAIEAENENSITTEAGTINEPLNAHSMGNTQR